MSNQNPLLKWDSYKASMFLQQPPGTDGMASYVEPRGAKDPDFTYVQATGISGWVQANLSIPYTRDDLYDARDTYKAHGEPFNFEGYQYILKEHNGLLPLQVQAIPEGLKVPLSIPLVQVRSVDPKCAFSVTPIETSLLRGIWYPSTVATNVSVIRDMLKAYAEKSSDNPNVDFSLINFGSRGGTSDRSTEIAGFAHASTGFMGSDAVETIPYTRKYYDADMPIFSIPAMEHSTVTMWGRSREKDAYENMIDTFGGVDENGNPNMFAIVIDAYDDENAVKYILGEQLRDKITYNGGKLIVRPDSGDPLTKPIEVIKWVAEKFGWYTNDKGYMCLPPFIGVLQGDGITKDSIKQILVNLEAEKISLDCLAFGQGGGMVQDVNRDTLQFAMKANMSSIDGKVIDVCKEPKSDMGKASKAGLQAVIYEDDVYQSIKERHLGGSTNLLKTVYDNGYVNPKWLSTLAEIRARSNA